MRLLKISLGTHGPKGANLWNAMWWLLLSGLCLTQWTTSRDLPEKGDLIVRVENISKKKGSLRFALYDRSEGFMDEENCVQGKRIEVAKAGVFELVFPKVPYGQYALVVHHDQNDNQKLDKNLLGIPTEPYAFSNDPDVKWRPPRFHEVAFAFTETGQVLTVYLRRWGER